MSTELTVIPSSALTEQEQADLNASIDSIIAAHKNNRQEINRLVFESVSAMTDSEGYEQELSNRKGLRRFWGAITGSNKRLQDKINSSRAAAQFAAQTTLQRLSEQNLLTFDLITAVNNRLNASMTAVEGEVDQIYAALIQFFKQNRSDMIQLENRVAKLEQNVNLLNWQNSIEYQMLDGVEYVDLDTLLSQSDLISLHCPLMEETHHMINIDTIQKMKDGVILVNTSRGGLIKTDDLIQGIRENKFFAVGLDVYEEENGSVYEDMSETILEHSTVARLLSFPNVMVTSHQAFFTEEALAAISEVTLDNAMSYLKGTPNGNEL
mgnify:CR=1 FL=1